MMEAIAAGNTATNPITAPRRGISGWPLVVFLAGLVTTASLSFSIYNADREKTASDFEAVAQYRVSALHKEFAEFDDISIAVHAFMDHVPADRTLPHNFSNFVRKMLGDEYHVRAVAWVLPNSADLHNVTQRGTRTLATGACNVQGITPASQAFRLCVLEPFENGEALLANGLTTNPELVAALTRVLQTDERLVVSGPPVATGGVTVEQARHRFFVFPVWQHYDGDRDVADVAGKLQGFLVIENYIPHMVEMGLALYTEGGGGVNIYLIDPLASGDKQLLHFHPSRLHRLPVEPSAIQWPDRNAPLVSVIPLQIGGRNWQLVVEGIPAVFNNSPGARPLTVLVAGILLSTLLALHLSKLANRNNYAEQLVADRTRTLAKTNSMLMEEMQKRQRADTDLVNQIKALDEHAIVSITDVSGNIIYINEKFCEVSQYSREELLGSNHRMLQSGLHSKAFFREQWQTISRDRVWKGELCDKKKDGTLYWLAATIVPFLNDEGKPYKYVGVHTDITAWKQTEQQLIARNNEIEQAHKKLEDSHTQLLQSEKLASVGQLAAGIAHEINTPTQFIGDNTRFLQSSFGELLGLLKVYETLGQAASKGNASPELIEKARALSKEIEVDYLAEEVPRAITQTLEGIERVTRIVRSMKEFSHPGLKQKELIDINQAIESTITVSHNEWKYDAELITDFDEVLTEVPCYPGKFNQVVLNIIINAAHAIKAARGDDGQLGTITISTRLDNAYAEIRISDTGTGIPEDVRKRIFEPFYTTKDVGKGSGQGLAIAYSIIVDEHEGIIDVDTVPGQGTTFILRLPMRVAATKTGTDKESSDEDAHSVCG